MPVVRDRRGGGTGRAPRRRRRGGVLTEVDLALVERALERAMAVARDGERADPPIEAPSEIQPFLGFRRLTGPARTAVARVIDRDEAFRARVLDADEGAGLDEAGELFLSRPPGWYEELASMAARRDAAVDAEAGAKRERELTRQRDRAEARSIELEEDLRDAVAQVQELGDELGAVRRARRSLTGDLDAAIARTEALERAREEARQRAAEAEAALEVRERELGQARDRLDDLEAELDRRPPAPEDATASIVAAEVARAVARLRRATDALDEAVEGAERLLPDDGRSTSPPPGGSSERNGAGRRPVPLPGGLRDDSAEAARHLVNVSAMTLLVDGYNVSMLAWPDEELTEQRERLIQRLELLASRTGVDPVVVFDGAQGHPPTTRRPHQQVRVRFSSPDVEADDEILELVDAHPPGRPVTVVSNDRRVGDGARVRGANLITSTQLLEIL